MKTTDTYGLKNRNMQTLLSIFCKYAELQKAILFGSRAKISYHSGSDIDITIMGENTPYQLVSKIKNDISDTSLPCNVDLINFETITNQVLKEHIAHVGKLFYSI